MFDHGKTGTWSRRLPSHLPSFITPGVSHIAGAGSREQGAALQCLQASARSFEVTALLGYLSFLLVAFGRIPPLPACPSLLPIAISSLLL